MARIALFGECMIELNGTPFGQMWQTYGGDSLNTATYLARLGDASTQVQYITAMGTDPLSNGMINRWEQDNIDTSSVLRDPIHQPGLYLIQLDEQGERTFLYWRNQSAARHIMDHPQATALFKKLIDVDYLYLSGISLAILPALDRDILIDRMTSLKDNGVKIVFDSNYRPALWQDMAQTQEAYNQVLALTDIALLTYDDELALWEDKSPQQTISRSQALGCQTVVVKLGSKGCLYHDGTSQQTIETTPVTNVVDTTAAGDSFNGGFLAAYLAGQSLTESCAKGNATAGIVIQHKGAIIDPKATAHLKI